MVRGLEHVGLSVSDLDRSISFYCEVMGLAVERIIECGPEMGLGRVVGIKGAAARIAHLSSQGAMLELFEYTNPRGSPVPENAKQADHGLIHIGFSTDDVRREYSRLRQKGVEFFGEPVEFRPGVWVVYFYGPDGEVCELRQT
ncbi:MAG: VOC family protein [Spirochaetota bacterium]